MLSEDKAAVVERRQAEAASSPWPANGVNDAPALAAAAVGIAMGAGTDVAMECAA